MNINDVKQIEGKRIWIRVPDGHIYYGIVGDYFSAENDREDPPVDMEGVVLRMPIYGRADLPIVDTFMPFACIEAWGYLSTIGS